jgi:mannosyl-3-phosphoglycerate synthase
LKIEIPRYSEVFGALRINEVQRVYELDSGLSSKLANEQIDGVANISKKSMNEIEKNMAIVVLTKNEKLKLLDGVISGIPHDCLIIVVSNSDRRAIDRYKNETAMMNQFNKFARRKVMMVHQRDPGLALSLREVGYTDILRGKSIRSGKGEGALIGLILAKIANKSYIGFVDSDNFIPGAVHEYVKNFNSGFSLASSPYSMVRISWLYKPTATETGFYFSRWGRVNEYANKYLNRVISMYTGFGTEIIKTGNSGEYAMSMNLAENLTFASGSSVEPYSMLNLLEEFGPTKPIENKDIREKGVQVYQIETRNPHIHVDKGDEHLVNMLLSSIGIIYHSKTCNDALRNIMTDEIIALGLIRKGEKPPKVHTLGPIKNINFDKLKKSLELNSKTLIIMGKSISENNDVE